MHISSVNIGEAKTISWRGKDIQTGIYKYPVKQAIYLGNEDVENDHVIDRRYHGGLDKACYLFSKDHYSFWKEKYPNLDWDYGMFGENLTISSFNENRISIGDIFKIGEAIVQITQPRQPCFKLGVRFGTQKMVKQFVESGHSGAYVRVIKTGNVKKDDEMILQEQMKNSMSLGDIFRLLYDNHASIKDVKKALLIESLAQSCKNDLKKRFNL